MIRGVRALSCALFVAAFATTLAASSDGMKVSTSPAFFNPSLGRSGMIVVESSAGGSAAIEILDRDRFVVRKLSGEVASGRAEIAWDGKDGAGRVVPDEAYSVRVTLTEPGGRKRVFDPGEEKPAEPISIDQFTYSRTDGVLNYKLPRASRVHIQAGQARKSKDGTVEGPILRTVVDRSPRSGGAISEQWTGFDESRTIYIPDLPNFVVAILASPLPDGSLITIGNRKLGFAEYAKSRSGMERRAAGRHAQVPATHHRGLAGTEDRSPRVQLARTTAESATRWEIGASGPLEFQASVPEELAPVYLRPGARLLVYRDLEQVATVICSTNPCGVSVPQGSIPVGAHRLAVNWDSGRGPVGIGLVEVERR